MEAFVTYVQVHTPVDIGVKGAANMIAHKLFETRFVVLHSWPNKRTNNKCDYADMMTTQIVGKHKSPASTSA